VGMFVCCVLSGRGLCDGLITRPKESYRLWRVVVCDQETSNEETKARYEAVENTTERVVTPRKQTTTTTNNSLHVSSTSCSSSGEMNCVNTTSGSCRWPCRVQVGSETSDLHTTRSSTQSDSYQRLY